MTRKQRRRSSRSTGDLLREKGDVAGARQCYAGALALWQEMKQEGEAAEAQLALLELDLGEGKARQVDASARQLLDAVLKQKSPVREANVRLLLARSAAAQDRAADAKREAERARMLAIKGQDRSVRLRQDIAFARVLGALGDADRSWQSGAQHAQSEAGRMGIVPLVFEARVALGEIEVRTSPAAARVRLRELQKEAELKGFKAIAQRAAAAAR